MKRKSRAKRHPSGQVVRETEPPEMVGKLARLRHGLLKAAGNPLLGFPLGRLYVERYISHEEYSAGAAWAELTFRHAQIIGLMLPMPKAISWQGRLGASLSDPPKPERIEAVKIAKDLADQAIIRSGAGALGEAQAVILCDLEPGHRRLLKGALQALIERRLVAA